MIKYWQHREVLIPQSSIFTLLGEDTVVMQMANSYKIVSYLDSIGCISCKARLAGWKDFIADLESENVPVFIFMNTSNLAEIQLILKRESFNYPICIDEKDSLNKLNHFPSDMRFQTFLLNKDNRVLAIGNPIHNPKVKDLYLNIIQGKEMQPNIANKTFLTSASVNKVYALLGYFDWQKEQKASFMIKNVGNKPLIIQDINTSCGCTTVSYSKEPVQPGKEMKLDVSYKADHPEHFSKTLTVYCNAESSPIRLIISGDAK